MEVHPDAAVSLCRKPLRERPLLHVVLFLCMGKATKAQTGRSLVPAVSETHVPARIGAAGPAIRVTQ